MIERETRQETVNREVITLRACDLCGEKCPGMIRGNWEGNGYGSDFSETEVSFKEGTRYPECGSAVEKRIDICPNCFLTKLIPWLESQGASIQEVETDY